jgi:hypothetical protein
MRKVRMVVPLVAAVLAIVGILAVSGRADKPESPPGQSKPEPVDVRVAGAIDGEGNPYAIRITFVDDSFAEQAGTYVSNPDYPPSLKVGGSGKAHKRLQYYYCNGAHGDSDTECEDSSHDPDNYKSLTIYGGTEDKKAGQVVFPAGSSWRIMQKIVEGGEVRGELVAEGALAGPVTYEVLAWGTP